MNVPRPDGNQAPAGAVGLSRRAPDHFGATPVTDDSAPCSLCTRAQEESGTLFRYLIKRKECLNESFTGGVGIGWFDCSHVLWVDFIVVDRVQRSGARRE